MAVVVVAANPQIAAVVATLLQEQRIAFTGFTDEEIHSFLEHLGSLMLPVEEERYPLIIECFSQAEQQEIYNVLTEQGYLCRIPEGHYHG